MSALNKWKWLAKATQWVRKNLPSIPGVGIVCDIVDAINNQFKFEDPTLTTAENLALSMWEEKLFLPFLEYVLRKQAIIYSTTATDFEKTKIVNSILIEVNAVMMYYSKNPDNLTTKASEVQRNYVDKFLNAIIDNIFNEYLYQGFDMELFTTTLNEVVLNVKPLNIPGSFSVELIKIPGVAVAQTIATASNSSAAIMQTVATAPLATNVVQTATAPKSNLFKIVAFLGLSALALKYAFSSEKE